MDSSVKPVVQILSDTLKALQGQGASGPSMIDHGVVNSIRVLQNDHTAVVSDVEGVKRSITELKSSVDSTRLAGLH